MEVTAQVSTSEMDAKHQWTDAEEAEPADWNASIPKWLIMTMKIKVTSLLKWRQGQKTQGVWKPALLWE